MFELCIKNVYFWGKKWMKDHAKTKFVPDKVKQARLTSFKGTATREWGQNRMWPQLSWNKGLEWFMSSSTGIIGYLSLLIVLTQRKVNFPWQVVLLQLVATQCRSYVPPLPETGIAECYLLCWLHFQGMAPRSLRKTFLGCRPGKRLLERYSSQRGRKSTYQFSKVNALRQGEARGLDLKFYPMEETLKLLVNHQSHLLTKQSLVHDLHQRRAYDSLSVVSEGILW